MKKTAIVVLILVALSFLFASFVIAKNNEDFQAIKKAVKKNPAFEKGKEVKWFKVLITDAHSKKERVRITLPIKLIEIFLKFANNKHLRIDDGWDCDINLEELFNDLKELGSEALIEVREDDEIIKVWLE